MLEDRISRKDFLRLSVGSAALVATARLPVAHADDLDCAERKPPEPNDYSQSGPTFVHCEEHLIYSNPFDQHVAPAWYEAKLIYHLNLGVATERPPYPIAGQYLFVYQDDFQNPTTVEGFFAQAGPLVNAGQHVIFDAAPGDPDYSPIWHNHWVLVPRDYEINSLRSEEAVLQSGYPIVESPFYIN
ncbi:MAG: hypothetical protein M5U01_20765 [Ardenticatenaceae bacterium]|nr:hypothetical protein [Ardenticatenaceae bacterium]HBY96682.1 hypothetical protein [Chloroflexota bacterium]